MVKEKKAIEVLYKQDKDYRLYPVTGAYGGPSPSGEIIIDFFVERRMPPNKITLEIEEDGSAPIEVRSEKNDIARIMQLGIIMRPDIAQAIGKLLIEKAEQIQDLKLK